MCFTFKNLRYFITISGVLFNNKHSTLNSSICIKIGLSQIVQKMYYIDTIGAIIA